MNYKTLYLVLAGINVACTLALSGLSLVYCNKYYNTKRQLRSTEAERDLAETQILVKDMELRRLKSED